MFKIFRQRVRRRKSSRSRSEETAQDYIFVRKLAIPAVLLSVSLLGLPACRTAPLPRINLQEPGWTIREGQAVWKRNREAPEIAGELLVATAPGRTFVQFSKTPFPMVVGQSTTNKWQVEIPTQGKRYSAPGKPPARLIWLYLPGMLAGQAPPKRWSFQQLSSDRWRVENEKTGESIEGYLEPPRK